MSDVAEYRPSWRIRRRIIILSLSFCAGGIGYLLGWGADTQLNNTIANGLILAAVSIIGSYVFGAAWDDKNLMSALRPSGGASGRTRGSDEDRPRLGRGGE